ncbi:hypothetical protein [Allokutzneria albata]|uniref:Uncharacterized protein n=1 Tax=Allokutzneria albata TaxID=211114 RepID=A0A1G9SUX3_ALLAB|nr:hypothetical protein [Allokutzneria albata]SDM39144.1 hypothetical protein SAMN04489726_1392 [Allokutzneria albata]
MASETKRAVQFASTAHRADHQPDECSLRQDEEDAEVGAQCRRTESHRYALAFVAWAPPSASEAITSQRKIKSTRACWQFQPDFTVAG